MTWADDHTQQMNQAELVKLRLKKAAAILGHLQIVHGLRFFNQIQGGGDPNPYVSL